MFTREGLTMLSMRTARPLLLSLAIGLLLPGQGRAETAFTPIPTQYIAALGDPGATSGTGAEAWGLWRVDPGPRGVELTDYETLAAQGGIAPAQWSFDG